MYTMVVECLPSFTAALFEMNGLVQLNVNYTAGCLHNLVGTVL